MFNRLKLGTKMIGFILTVVTVCLAVMSIVIITRSSSIQKGEAEKLLMSEGSTYSNLVRGIFNEMFYVLESQHGNVEGLISRGVNENVLLNSVATTLDSSGYANYGYIYLKNTNYSATQNNAFLLPNNDFLALLVDTDSKGVDGIKILQADPIISELDSVKRAMQTNKPTIGVPAVRNIANAGELQGVAINFPLEVNGAVIGVLGLYVNLNDIGMAMNDPKESVFPGDIKFIVTGDGIIAMHPQVEFLGKHFTQANGHPSVKVITDAIQDRKDGVYGYTSTRGLYSITSVNTFEIGRGLGLHWAAVVLAPEESVMAPVRSLVILIIQCAIVALIVIAIAVFFYIRQSIIARIHNISHHLFQFFKCLNHETDKCPVMLKPKAIDEFGEMAIAINDNIEKVQAGLEQDTKAVQESIATANEIENGNLKARITETPKNPQLNELKIVLNKMLDVLELKIGSNMNTIQGVFDSYKTLDFTTEIPNAKGAVETTTNILGQAIREMLRTSESYAKDLAQKTELLKESMHKLFDGSNTQAASLQQSAAAIEEISSSMQNVNDKTSEVSRQAEDIKNIVGVIKDIADQTNLLALNAAIEAARAGEHGRGFAVVADEVRKLAERTSKSLNEIEANVNVLVQGVSDMSGSIKEQTAGIAQINDAIAQLESVTQDNVSVANTTNEITDAVDVIAEEILSDVNKKKF